MESRGTRAAAVAALAAGALFSAPAGAGAEVAGWNFESPRFTVFRALDGQSGWTNTGGYDAEIVQHLGAPLKQQLGEQSLRISNGLWNSWMPNQVHSPGLVDEAGEAEARSRGNTGGKRRSQFAAQFTFLSTQATEQPGLMISVSPTMGLSGTRLSYLRIEDTPGGLDVIFNHAPSPVPDGAGEIGFEEIVVGEDLSRTEPHTVALELDLRDGPDNDVVRVSVDGVLKATGTTWENYYRHDVNMAVSGNLVPTVDRLGFYARAAASSPVTGQGFRIDDVRIESADRLPAPPAAGPAGPAGAPGATGATGATGPQGPDGIAPDGPRVAPALIHEVRLAAAGKATARVFCPAAAGTCRGRATLRADQISLAAGRFAIRGGRSAVVALRVTRRGRPLLRRFDGRTLRLRAVSASHDANGFYGLRSRAFAVEVR